MTLGKIFPYTFIFVVLALFVYSFTQIDLGLTISSFPVLHGVEMGFKEIGYFARPVSTVFYVVIVGLMFIYFIYFLNLSIKKKLKMDVIWKILIISSVILTFSYIAFSHDLFNYIFDAKIITYYHENPYTHKALDFPQDPMLSFMHWTHRIYPYGPFWLVLTAPLSFIGMNVFLLTFFLFKIFATAFYLGSVYLIYKINKKINPGNEIFNTVFFALNPLVIIETLVSSHNDIAMVFFAFLGIYFYLIKSKILGIFLVILSAAIKIPTVLLLLPMVINILPIKKYHLSSEKFIWSIVALSILGIFYSMTQLEIQPWYFLWALPFISLLRPNKYVICLTLGASIGLLLRYTVFLYSGNWDGVLIVVRNSLTIISIIISVVVAFVWSYKKGYNLRT